MQPSKTVSQPEVAFKSFQIRLPLEIHRRIKVEAAAKGISPGRVIERLVEQYLPEVTKADAA